MISPSAEWLDELDLDPTAPAVAMRTRGLGTSPWLMEDEAWGAQLELKAAAHRHRLEEVYVAAPASIPAAEELLASMVEHGVNVDESPDRPPLVRAGCSVQEDLCLLERRQSGWVFAAGSVSFPSRWRLSDKVGRTVTEVHAPVRGYAPALAARVETLFDRLTDRPVWRRNWFVHADATLFQPAAPVDELVIGPDECLRHLTLRSERQTLRQLPSTGWIVFTIHTQQWPLAAVARRRGAELARYLSTAPDAELGAHDLSPAQGRQIVLAIDQLEVR